MEAESDLCLTSHKCKIIHWVKNKTKEKPKPKAWKIISFTRKDIYASWTAEKVQERQHDTENKPQAVRVYWLRFFRQCHNNRNRIVYIIFVNLLWLLELALPGFAVINTANIQLSTANSWGGTHIITKSEGRTAQNSLKLLIARFTKCSQSLFLRSVCSAQWSTAYQFFILHLLDFSSSLILSYNASEKFRVVWESVFGIFSREWVKIPERLFWFLLSDF